MRKHYKDSAVLKKIEDAIDHATLFELPLISIELNPEEWRMFRRTVLSIPGWARAEADFGAKTVYYHGIKIFEGPAP